MKKEPNLRVFSQGTMFTEVRDIDFHGKEVWVKHDILNSSHFINFDLCEFDEKTPHKDKNGSTIYENDILLTDEWFGELDYIENAYFIKQRHGVWGLEPLLPDKIKRDEDYWQPCVYSVEGEYHSLTDQMEIIGNTHEDLEEIQKIVNNGELKVVRDIERRNKTLRDVIGRICVKYNNPEVTLFLSSILLNNERVITSGNVSMMIKRTQEVIDYLEVPYKLSNGKTLMSKVLYTPKETLVSIREALEELKTWLEKFASKKI